jgi:hypothetical protein
MQLVYTYAKGDDMKDQEAKEAKEEEAKHAEEKSADRLAEEKEALDAEQTEKGDQMKEHRKKVCRVWIGEHDSLTPMNCEELKVTHVICIMRSEDKQDIPHGLKWGKSLGNNRDSKNENEEAYADNDDDDGKDNKKSLYIPGFLIAEEKSDKKQQDKDQHFQLLPLILDLDDDDRGEDSWNEFTAHMQMLVISVAEAVGGEENTLLIIDETGDNLSAAVFCSFMLLKKQVRIESAVSMCTSARPSVSISMSIRRGLEKLQRTLDEKRLGRLRAKMRTAQSASIAF